MYLVLSAAHMNYYHPPPLSSVSVHVSVTLMQLSRHVQLTENRALEVARPRFKSQLHHHTIAVTLGKLIILTKLQLLYLRNGKSTYLTGLQRLLSG